MANEGNQWWKNRSKHGRELLFASAQLMWDAACEYFQSVIDDPIIEEQLFSFQGVCHTGTLKKQRPFTYEGLCLYFDTHTAYFRQFRAKVKKYCEEFKDLPDDHDEKRKWEDFATVIQQIDNIIMKQQFDGAASGQLKESIVARYLGMKDKTEVSTPADGEGEFKVTLKL